MAKRVLLVDDDRGFVETLGGFIEKHGFVIAASAANAEEAIGLADDCRPDVVLVDVRMPNVTGFDCAAQLSASRPGVPVVMLSPISDSRYVREAFLNGFAAYVSKSRITNDLVPALNTVISGGTYIAIGQSANQLI